jgi:hypothetical protein
MSGPVDVASAAAGEAVATASSPTLGTPPSSLPLSSTMLAMLLAGALVAGAAAGAIVSRSGTAGPAALQAIARSELELAKTSLQPDAAAQAIEEARQCKTPLASITVRAAPGSGVQRIRVHSGSYATPWLLLSDAPRRMAIPFPAPYLTGKGELMVEAATQPVTLWLTPAKTVGPQLGTDRIPVIWATNNPCPP